MYLEQGVDRKAISDFRSGMTEHDHPCRVWAPPRMNARPMDLRVRKLLIPTILTLEWPKLTCLRITGMTRWEGRPGIGSAQRKQLERHLGSGVNLILEGISDRPCVDFYGMRSSSQHRIYANRSQMVMDLEVETHFIASIVKASNSGWARPHEHRILNAD